MHPSELGKKYDKIAQWWHDQHEQSSYGVGQLERAIGYGPSGGKALDVGCGTGGRFVRLLQSHGFSVTGLDVSKEMVKLAGRNHPEHKFTHQDICSWETEEKFDFTVAWDSIFHLPLEMQEPVVSKLCDLLAKGGILLYSFGSDQGEHTDQWHNDTFYYSSIGIDENMQLLIKNGFSILHLELDQYPEKYVYSIAIKP
jgi:2-polyprenyl-3-methyl-5-hydroxy-6-metoxy-1,4-benzoquinol methylase